MRFLGAIVTALAACGGSSSGGAFFGEASVDVSGSSDGSQISDGTMTWTHVLAFGFSGRPGSEPFESAVLGTDDVDPCGPTLDIRFEGPPATATHTLPAFSNTVAIRRGTGSRCPDEPDERWEAQSGQLSVELDGDLITVMFDGVPMAPVTSSAEPNDAAGTFTISGTATANSYR